MPENVRVQADLTAIPIQDFPIITGADGEPYYAVQFALQMTHYSAYTKYELIYKGINYGTVSAEYM